MSLLRCRFHIVAQEPSDKIAKYCPTRSLDRCTESVLIGRLLEVEGDSVKAFNFTRVWNTTEGKQDCACKMNEYGRTAEETFTW